MNDRSPVTDTVTPGKTVVRMGDRVFAGTARIAAILIMVALAGVAVFLLIEGLPGFTADADIYRPADNFWSYVGPLVWGTVLAAIVALIIAIPFSIGVALFI